MAVDDAKDPWLCSGLPRHSAVLGSAWVVLSSCDVRVQLREAWYVYAQYMDMRCYETSTGPPIFLCEEHASL
jgi:hypothetical protein